MQTMCGPPLLSCPAKPTNLLLIGAGQKWEIELNLLEVPNPECQPPLSVLPGAPPALRGYKTMSISVWGARMALLLLFCPGPFPFRLQLFSFLPDTASTQTDLPTSWLLPSPPSPATVGCQVLR